MPRFNIHHVTRYTYEQPVRDSANQVVLFPIKDEYQDVVKQELHITGEPTIDLYKDYYGNEIGSFTHAEPHTELVIDSKLEIVVKAKPLPADNHSVEEQWKQLSQTKYQPSFIDFIRQENFTAIDELTKAIGLSAKRQLTPFQAAIELNEYVFKNFAYNKSVTDVETTVDEIWKLKAGVCQDFAHVLLAMLRLLDIPARYVSGYICPNKSGMRGEGATHAWAEAYLPFYGWLGLDPTNNCIANDQHVRLAVGRSFRDVSPVKGTYKGTERHTLEVGVTVSYENGARTNTDATPLVLTPQKSKNSITPTNSYRRHLEMMQQQQQQ